jgi:glycosyltransferase involved in cell wall biosynthesis
MPMVSVVIPAYNAAAWIDETLESVQAQTYRDSEIIVVDDGSSDETEKVVARFSSIKYIYRKNGGAAAARNDGIRAARGEYVAFLDADDLWLPDKLSLQIDLLERTGLNWVYSGAYAIDGQTGRTLFTFGKLRRQYSGDVLKPLFIEDFVPSPTPIVRRAVFDIVGYFDEATIARGVEDWDMWLRIAARYPIGLIGNPLACYRVHAASTVQTELATSLLGKNLYVIELALKREPERLERLRSESTARMYIRIGQLCARRKNLIDARKMFAKAIFSNPLTIKAYVYWFGTFVGQRAANVYINSLHWLRRKSSGDPIQSRRQRS